MPKSAWEKQFEKQMRQQKQQAERALKQAKREAQEAERLAKKELLQKKAEGIVSGQPIIDGFRILDSTAETVLQCLLEQDIQENNAIHFTDEIFPGYLQMGIPMELEKLTQYGMISGLICFCGGGMLNLLPPAFTYFKDKDAAYTRQAEKEEKISSNFFYNTGNMIFGNVSDSTLSVDNSIQQLDKIIDEKGGEETEELHELLNEVKELIDNIEASRAIPKQKRLFQKISDHAAKHGWFYGAVVQLLGTTAMTLLGK